MRRNDLAGKSESRNGISTYVKSRNDIVKCSKVEGSKCLNVKYKRTDALSLWHQQKSTTVDIHGPLQTRGETSCPGGVNVSYLASRNRNECPWHNKSVYMESWHWMWSDTISEVSQPQHTRERSKNPKVEMTFIQNVLRFKWFLMKCP